MLYIVLIILKISNSLLLDVLINLLSYSSYNTYNKLNLLLLTTILLLNALLLYL